MKTQPAIKEILNLATSFLRDEKGLNNGYMTSLELDIIDFEVNKVSWQTPSAYVSLSDAARLSKIEPLVDRILEVLNKTKFNSLKLKITPKQIGLHATLDLIHHSASTVYLHF